MNGLQMQQSYQTSLAYQELQPLRIPAGWTVRWNTLRAGLDASLGNIGGSSIFTATNAGRRFQIDVEFRPEFDPNGSFNLFVQYQPWPRSEGGRRIKTEALTFNVDAEIVHEFQSRSYSALVDELEHWIARCTVWEREGS